MLILTRRVGESLYIDGKKIKVKALGLNKETGIITLGIKASKEIKVCREEIYEKYNQD